MPDGSYSRRIESFTQRTEGILPCATAPVLPRISSLSPSPASDTTKTGGGVAIGTRALEPHAVKCCFPSSEGTNFIGLRGSDGVNMVGVRVDGRNWANNSVDLQPTEKVVHDDWWCADGRILAQLELYAIRWQRACVGAAML